MNREQLLARRDYFNMVHGVTIRAIATLTDHELDFRPMARSRTPRELIFHIYAQERLLAEAARDGRFTMEAALGSNPEDPSNASAVAALARQQHDDGHWLFEERIVRLWQGEAVDLKFFGMPHVL